MERLLEALGRLPGIGRRSAERIAYHLLRAGREEALELAAAIRDLKEKLIRCGRCRNLAEADPCRVCADPGRDAGLVCVVEQPKDVVALEETGVYRGLYYVLLGKIAPLEGEEEADLDLAPLLERARAGGLREVIVATNPTLEGEATALFVQRALKSCPDCGKLIVVTRAGADVTPGTSVAV